MFARPFRQVVGKLRIHSTGVVELSVHLLPKGGAWSYRHRLELLSLPLYSAVVMQ